MPETALVFLLAFVIGLASALFVKPIYGLYTYVAVFYLHPPSRWWGESLPDLRWSLFAAVVTLIAIQIHKDQGFKDRSWLSVPMLALFGVFALWMWIQAPWVVSGYHVKGAVLFTKYVLLIYLMYRIIDTERDFQGFCLVHVLGCAYFGILIFLAPDGGRLEGVGGPGVNNANTLGMHLVTGLIFASFMLLSAKGWMRWVILGSIPLILNGIIQTETRGALVGLFAGGLLTVYLKPAKIRKMFYALSIVAAFGFLAIANEAFLARMSTMNAAIDEEAQWDTSAQSRVEIAKSQFDMFTDYPLGAGHQGTAWLSPRYIAERWLVGSTGDRASHNTVMSVLVDQGVPGIILFILIIWSAVKMLVRLKKMDKHGLSLEFGLYRAMLGGALCSIMASGMFAQYLKAEVQIWSLALLAVLMRLASRSLASQPEAALPVDTIASSADPENARP